MTRCFGLVLMGLLAWGCLISEPSRSQGEPATPQTAGPEGAAEGRQLFNGTCAVCHGANAGGGRGPALNTGQFGHGGEERDLVRTIRNGIPTGGMPSFAQLADRDVQHLVQYLRSLSPVSEAALEVVGSDDAARAGETYFFGAGKCASCHEINGHGAGMAADLSAIGLRGSDFVRAGIEHGVPPRVRGARLSLIDGTEATGRVLSENAVELLLVNESGTPRIVKRSAIASATPYRLTPSEPIDGAQATPLLAFLSRQRVRAVAQSIAPTGAQRLTPERLAQSAREPQNWLTYWGDYAGHHFSRLSEINASNVGSLQAQWAAALPGGSALETTPIVVDGVMYVSGSPGEVYALDAQTGLQIWKFTRKQDAVNPYQINPYNRGVAVLGARVFVGTLDDLLIALDARTGRELWERRIAEPLDGYTISGAPLALKNQVIVGVGCGEYGVRGFLEAYDAASGQRLWRFETIPSPGQPGHDSWAGDSWQRGGGGTWLTGSYDPKLDTLYWTVGNPAPSNNWAVRRGDNLYTDSLLALDPNNGRLKWHYQFTPNDSHDWDSVQDVILTDREIAGKPRNLLLHADRNGFLYTLDRRSGEFISAQAFVKQTWNDGFSATGRPLIRPSSVATPDGQSVFPATSATNFQSPSFDAGGDRLFLVFRDAEGLANYGPPIFERGNLYTAPGTASPKSSTPPSTGIMALDAVTGVRLWTHALPRFAPQAGVLATAGGVVFAGSAEGSVIALNSDTGADLWHFGGGNQVFASPISYEVQHRQYIALAAGNTLYAFALPKQSN